MSSRKSKTQGKSKKDEPFEDVMERLGGVVERLEKGELPLEESLAMFEEGVRLSRIGSQRLDEAELRIEELLAEGDGVSTESIHNLPSEASAEDGRRWSK